MKNFGEKLRYLREQQGWSLRDLSQNLEVGYSYIAKMERGEKTPNVAMVLKISDLFKVSTDSLLKDDIDIRT